jgi:hypothetical protein
MITHHLFLIDAFLPPGGGDALSWFRFYKWADGLESVFVPLQERALVTPNPAEWEEGDVLWFVRETEDTFTVEGAVPLLRTMDGLDTLEVWYDVRSRVVPKTPLRISTFGARQMEPPLLQNVLQQMWLDVLVPAAPSA